ncbi:MAG: DUF5694 domain-containing protein [Marinifilaceae bacterium]|jgi:hypothetical protein|nr:DUF5694 domain-containing protein [Marinifilaceae bacterium]
MKTITIFILLFCSILSFTQNIPTEHNQIKVLTLGTFHFNFPNLDVRKIAKSDQIDVLEDKYQNEIRELVSQIAEFKPTKIIIEKFPNEQAQTDSCYNAYIKGKYQLKRDETNQIGFRLAKKLNHKKLFCVDQWGDYYGEMKNIIFGKNKEELNKFISFTKASADSSISYKHKHIFKNKGIIPEIKSLNNPENIKKSLGNYLIGNFKYESNEGDFMGVHFQTSRWFNRNLKIFRNIQDLELKPDDRLLVIFGAGHMNLLNIFFDSSPEFELVNCLDYLK